MRKSQRRKKETKQRTIDSFTFAHLRTYINSPLVANYTIFC